MLHGRKNIKKMLRRNFSECAFSLLWNP